MPLYPTVRLAFVINAPSSIRIKPNPPAAEPTVMDVDLHLLLGVCSVPQSVSDGMRPSDA